LIATIVVVTLSFTPTAIAQDTPPMGAMPVGEQIVAGLLTINQAWSRATPPGAATGAGYLTISNSGVTDDRLLSVASAEAAIGEIHDMTMVADRMTMRPVADGVVIPAGGTVVLQPGGLHLMFVQVGAGFVEGSVVAVTLTFEIAGVVEIGLVVYPIGSDGPTEGADAMEGMAMDGLDSAGAGP
jgi:copper(I)-binding protein